MSAKKGKLRLKAKSKAKENDPLQSLETILETAQACQDQLDYENAAKLYYKALELDPNNYAVMDELGEILIALDECEVAKQVLERSIELAPQAGWSKYMNIGQLLDAEGALKAYRTGLELLIRHRETLPTEEEKAVLGSQIASGFCSMAELYLTDLCFDPSAETECEKLLDMAARYGPQSPEPLQVLANVRISQKRNAEALQALQKSMSLWVGKEDTDDAPSYDFRITTGQLLIELGAHQQAADVLHRLTEEDDEVLEVWYFLGVALSNFDTVAAEDCLRQASELLGRFGVAEGDPIKDQIAELLQKMAATNAANPPPPEDDGGDEDEGDGGNMED